MAACGGEEEGEVGAQLLSALSLRIKEFILAHVDDTSNHIRKRDAQTKAVCNALEMVFLHHVRLPNAHFFSLKRTDEAEEAAQIVWAFVKDHLLSKDAMDALAGV